MRPRFNARHGIWGHFPADATRPNRSNREITSRDWRKGLVARLIREHSLVANRWLRERLHMGARNAVSRTIGQYRNQLKTGPTARQMDMRIRENVTML